MTEGLRLLFLSKRMPQKRDLLTSPYGRFFHLPLQLQLSGNVSQIALLSYGRLSSAATILRGMSATSDDLLPSTTRYYRRLDALLNAEKFDWIIGFSDILYGVLAVHLARRHRCLSLIDAYDNYESYMPWNRPLHFLWRRALRHADAVTAAGPQLAELLNRSRRTADAHVVPMAADAQFSGGEKFRARRALNLPLDRKIVLYCGSMGDRRDSGTLLDTAAMLPACLFVRSGAPQKGSSALIRDLGYIDSALVPELYRAADVAVVTAADNAFGAYAYPAKLYEALSCGTPVVCADLAPLRWIASTNAVYYQTGNAMTLRDAIVRQIDQPVVGLVQSSWERSAQIFEQVLLGGTQASSR